MSVWPEHVAGTTVHARRGAIGNAFRYGVDYVLIDPASAAGPRLFSRNRFNLLAVHDRDHGGAPGAGRGAVWAREVLDRAGLPAAPRHTLRLLTQPRFVGYGFNPVSFWIAADASGLRAVIAEVNNTYGDRHSYLCHRPGFAPIRPADRITAKKIMHVSPFQEVAGRYHFNFDIRADRIAIRILHERGGEGVVATLHGRRRRLGNGAILGAALRRPAGALRTFTLIHWQALKLSRKGARFRARPLPPKEEVS